jgi:Cu(I)/Ag(I) efflux system membrane fusion protein
MRTLALIAAALAGAAVCAVAMTALRTAAPAAQVHGDRWQCPMHPDIVQEHPGDCPVCGMKLVRVDAPGAVPAGASVPGLAGVDIDPSRQQLIGLTTAAASAGEVGGTWRTVGRVAIDETRVRHVNVKVPGFVERIFVDFVGKPVKKGEPLFTLFSPELLSAQEELLLAVRTRDALKGGMVSGGDDLVRAARRRLELWDVPGSEVDHVLATGEAHRTLTFRSPASGVVTRKEVVEGMKLDAGAMPYEIVDLSEVWVLADVYESELARVHVGMPASFALKAFPGRNFEGHVAFVDPLLDPGTRTVKVRLSVENPHGELRPEMFGEVQLSGKPRQGLLIPADAVVDSGTRKVVFAALEGGRFEPRVIKVGESDGKSVEVTEGLSPGDRVVTRANFLVDSESRLRASLAQLPGEAPAPAAAGAEGAGHEHMGHTP